MLRSKVKSEFVDPFIQPIGPQTGAAGVLVGFEKKDRPILHVIRAHGSNLPVQTLLHFLDCEWATD
jgi:hypothetical protein